MKNELKSLSSPFYLGLFFLLAGVFAFGTAQFLQHILYLVPCELCYLERKPWLLLAAVGIFILFLKNRFFVPLAALGILLLCVSLGLGVLHIGVEQEWWASPFAACASQTSLYQGNHLDLLKNLPDFPAKPCDKPDYLLGVRLTFWSLLYTLLVLGGTLFLMFKKFSSSSLFSCHHKAPL